MVNNFFVHVIRLDMNTVTTKKTVKKQVKRRDQTSTTPTISSDKNSEKRTHLYVAHCSGSTKCLLCQGKLEKGQPYNYQSYGHYKGIFKLDKELLYRYIDEHFDKHKPYMFKYCLIEKKSEYYPLFFDFDLKEDKLTADLFLQRDKIVIYFIKKIQKVLESYIMLEEGAEYLFSDKEYFDETQRTGGVHLFYPKLVVNSKHAKVIRQKLVNLLLKSKKYKFTEKILDDVIDSSIYSGTHLRLMYQPIKGAYYKINHELSTYYVPYNIIDELRAVSLSTEYTDINWMPTVDKYDFPLIDNDYVSFFEKAKKEIKNNNVKEEVKNNDKENEETPKKHDLRLIEALIDNLNQKRLDDYQLWMRFIFMCAYEGFDEIAHRISKRNPKYKKESVDKLLARKRDFNNITVRSLYRWSYEDNPINHKRIMNKFLGENYLEINHTDEVLLCKYMDKIENTIEEDSKYISKEMIQKMLEYKTVILHSPTGSGKTTAINKMIKKFDKKSTILAVISRRTMSSTLKESFRKSNIGIDSYLDKNNSSKKQYIISLEKLKFIDMNYDIIILDEVNSLLSHFYSTTMNKSRRASFNKLLNLIMTAKQVIVADATITDKVLSFLLDIRKTEEICYYRNRYKNKEGVDLNVYFRDGIDMKRAMYMFCHEMLDLVKQKKSVMVACDSRRTACEVYNYLYNQIFNDNNKDELRDYFKLYDCDTGTLESLNNCNLEWKDKCVIFSPKIIYGLDVTIEYEKIFAVYKCHTIDSFSFLQQISRARNTKEVNMLFTVDKYGDKKNKYLSYQANQKIEEANLQNYLNHIKSKFDDDKINQKLAEVMQEMGNIKIDMEDKTMKINEEDCFNKIHLLTSWYTRLFSQNKAQLVLKLCEEQGYTINYKNLKEECGASEPKFEVDMKIFKQELVDQVDNVLNREEKEYKYVDYEERVSNIQESLANRMNMLGVSLDQMSKDSELMEIVKNKKVFESCLTGMMLFYTKEKIDDIILRSYCSDFKHHVKDSSLVKKLKLVDWMEKELEIDRFKIEDIVMEIDEIEKFKSNLRENKELLYCMKLPTGKDARDTQINKKIDNIDTVEDVKHLMTDVYNLFGNVITVGVMRKKKKGKKTRHYGYSNETSMNLQICFMTYSALKPDNVLEGWRNMILERRKKIYGFIDDNT